MSKVQVTQEQIDAWKKQYPTGISRLTLETGEEVYVRQPSTKEIEFASANIMQGKTYTFGITLFNTCRIGGDEIDPKNEPALRGIAQQMTSIIENVAVTVEKL